MFDICKYYMWWYGIYKYKKGVKLMNFDNAETERYYYEQLRKNGIAHISLTNAVITMEDVDSIMDEMKKFKAKFKKEYDDPC
jgi:hypothetical protein